VKALIDPRSGRVCELRDVKFAVADPLFWLEVGDEVTRMMLSAGDSFEPMRVGTAAGAGSESSLRRRPAATFSPRFASILSRCETIRARIAGVSTLDNSKVSAAAMWPCSIGIWLM
jgi:hypothetical protein